MDAPDIPTLAAAYHALGFNVLPTARDKKPTVLWERWQTERQSAADLAALPFATAAGVAAISGAVSAPEGAHLVNIDADRAPGDGVRLDLLGRLGLPRDYRWAVRTPGKGGGWHVWIIVAGLADGLAQRGLSSGRLVAPFPGTDHIELRWTKAYTLLPPSAHPDGTYRWHNGNGAVPSDGPLNVDLGRVVRLGKWAGETEDGTRAPAEPLPDEIISGSGQHPAMASFAGSMRRRGASEAAILAALRVENKRVCKPPLPDADLDHIAKSMMRYKPGAPVAAVADGTPRGGPQAKADEAQTQEAYKAKAAEFHLTDTGNAERLSQRHMGALLSVRGGRGLMAYDHDRGIFTTDSIIAQRYATETVRSIYAEAAAAEDMTQRRLLAEHAKRSESRNAMTAMLFMAETLKELEAWLEDFDCEPELLNVRNGVVSLSDGKLHDHNPKYRMTRSCTAAYVDTPCPRWEAHLQRIFDGNQSRIDFVQRLLGYSATGYSREQVFVVCYGGGANGKGVTLNTARAILGDYGASPAFTTFTMHRNDAIRNDLAALAGARLVTTSENRPGQTLDDGVIKQVTGCDPISARFLHCEHFTYVPNFVILLSTNHKPRVEVADYAMKRRVILLPFDVTIPPQEWDRNMETKLLAERDGILAWIVRGAMLYLAYGLEPPEDVTAATEQYREELDPLASFAETLTFDPGAWTAAADLRAALERWGKEEGLKTVPDGRALGVWLSARGVVPERHHGGRGWRGVRAQGADSEQSFGYDEGA